MQLKHGLIFGTGDQAEAQYEFEIRELTAGDLIDAEVASERVVMTPNGAALLPSQALMGYEILRRAVARVGKIQGPLSMTQLKTLHQEDLQIIATAASVHLSISLASAQEQRDQGR